MWRRLVRGAVPGNLNILGRSAPLQSSPQLLNTQFHGLTVFSAESSSFAFCDSSHFTAKSSFLCNPRFFSSNPFPETDEESPVGIPFPDSNDWGIDDTGPGSGSIFESDEKSDYGFDESIISSEGSKVESLDSRHDFYENPSGDSFEFNVENHGFDNLSSGNNVVSDLSVENESAVMRSEKNNEETREKFVEKIENVLSLLQSRGTYKSLESGLEGVGLLVNEEAMLKVLETPLIPAENLIGFFKWVLKKGDFRLTTNVVDALVKAIGHEPVIRDAYDLWDLVSNIGEKQIGVLSTDVLNQLICLFSNLGKAEAAYDVFTKFKNFGCVANEDTYFCVIDAVSKGSLFDLACSVCEKMLSAEKLPDSEKTGRIISYLCRGNKVNDAHTIYIWAKENNKFPPRSAVNSLIESLCHKGKRIAEANDKKKKRSARDIVSQEEKENIYHALEMLTDLSENDLIKHAAKPFSYVTKGLCRIRDFAGAKSLLDKMVNMGPPPGYTVFNTLITALSRAGDLEDAKEILKMMEGRGLKPDVYTYSIIVAGYVEGGAMEDACKVLDEAKTKHRKLSPCIYNSLIHGYCKLEEFESAVKYTREMKAYGVKPSANEYNKLIKLLCMKALDWRTSENLLQEMRQKGLYVYEKTKSLVRAVKELEKEGEEATTQALPASSP